MNTFEKIKKLFAEQLSISEDKIKLESDIIIGLQADSLDLYILTSSFDENFGISIPDEDIPSLRTIGDVVNYIDTHVGK